MVEANGDNTSDDNVSAILSELDVKTTEDALALIKLFTPIVANAAKFVNWSDTVKIEFSCIKMSDTERCNAILCALNMSVSELVEYSKRPKNTDEVTYITPDEASELLERRPTHEE